MDEATAPRAGSAGREAAFVALVRAHADVVFGVVVRRVRDRALAEDLTQETFLRAWRGFHAFRGDTGARGWLCAIATNVVRDDARRRRRRPVETPDLGAQEVAGGGDPAARAEDAEAIRRLGAALATLPENHREMFLLRERDGLSYREISDVLACPIGTVMSGLARARERLLEAMEG